MILEALRLKIKVLEDSVCDESSCFIDGTTWWQGTREWWLSISLFTRQEFTWLCRHDSVPNSQSPIITPRVRCKHMKFGKTQTFNTYSMGSSDSKKSIPFLPCQWHQTSRFPSTRLSCLFFPHHCTELGNANSFLPSVILMSGSTPWRVWANPHHNFKLDLLVLS